MTEKDLVERFQTSKGTILRIKKKLNQYLEKSEINLNEKAVQNNDNCLNTSQIKLKLLSTLVFESFSRLRQSSVLLNGTNIKDIAKKIAKSLKISDFKTSKGWPNNFLNSYDLYFKTISGELKSADTTSLEAFYIVLKQKLELYSPRDIWNYDETGLYFKNSSRKSFVAKNNDCKGIKSKKDKVTALFCVNMPGEKMNPLVLGKSAKPICFR